MNPALVVALFAALVTSSFANDISRTKRAIPAGRATGFDLVAREKLVIAHIKQRFGSYGYSAVTDPRFVIDPTMFVRAPGQKPAVPRQRPDYDYVFSSWSKERGRSFLENNAVAFERAERKFGVPREVINGILNIETQWGRVIGKRSVATTLYTLAVMRPDLIQPGWSEKQLIAFLAIFENSGTDIFSIKGSSMGAFGLAQFEPTSYTALAASCNDDNHHPNLFDNGDAICSIANYLHRSGWGTSEASHRHALFAYNHDTLYVAAILDYADWLEGRQSRHPRYQFFHPQKTEKVATK
jgi:membrane-bound lytic murein transglycosylase B